MDWEKNIFGMIPKEEWLDIGFTVSRPNDPVDNVIGDVKTDNIIAYYQTIASQYMIPMMAQFHGFDTQAQTTFRVPVDTKNIEKGLIKVKLNQSERLRALIRAGISNDAMYDYVVRDGVTLADQVVTRTKVAKNEMLATGKVTINENNLDLTVDYGVPGDQIDKSFDIGEDADVIAAVQELIDKALAKGVKFDTIYTSAAMLTKLRKNHSIQAAINGTVAEGQTVRRTAFEAFMQEEFGINRVVTNDLTYGESATFDNGTPTVKISRYYPNDRMTFLQTNPNGKAGIGLWGDPLEKDLSGYLTAGTSTVSPYVYVSQWQEDDPAVLWTKASALFIPILYNPSSLWVVKALGE